MKLKKTLHVFAVLALASLAMFSLLKINLWSFNTIAKSELPVHNIDTGLDYATIQEAIDASETLNGHTIQVDEGTYYEHVVVDKALTLIGNNKFKTTIDGQGNGTVIYITSDNVTITGFTIQNAGSTSGLNGIYIYRSSYNNISNNIIEGNYNGIYLYDSTNNTITNNNVLNNDFGIWVSASNKNTITTNNISTNSYSGIHISDSSHAIVLNNNISKNNFGIMLISSGNNTFTGNDISLNKKSGIYLYSSNNNTFSGNNISSNNDFGIWVSASNKNTITTNNISTNNLHGAYISNSTNNFILKNNISTNNQHGIQIDYSDNNIISCNNILKNRIRGLLLFYSKNNTIFHNNFINNTGSLSSINSTNSFDNGIEGNYWSNYNGTDNNKDGIGDTPYVIDGDNKDTYPLMGTFSEFTITQEQETYQVYIICNSTLSNFRFNDTAKRIDFSVRGINNTGGFCRTRIPKILINGPYITLIDNKEANATLLPISNVTHTFLYFTYTNGTHEVTIASRYYYELLEKYSKLLEEYQKLNITYHELLNSYDELLANFDHLNTTYQELLKQYRNLNTTYQELLNDHALLLENYNTLNVTYHKLLDSYNTLNATYNALFRNYTELQDNYGSLQISYNTLATQYDSLNSLYYKLNFTYNNLLVSYHELESNYNVTIKELTAIKDQMNIFIATTIIETIAVIGLILLSIKYRKTFNKQKKLIQTYKRQLEKISHLEGARARFQEDVKKRKVKIEKFEKKYNVNIRPHRTLEDIIKSMKLEEEKS